MIEVCEMIIVMFFIMVAIAIVTQMTKKLRMSIAISVVFATLAPSYMTASTALVNIYSEGEVGYYNDQIDLLSSQALDDNEFDSELKKLKFIKGQAFIKIEIFEKNGKSGVLELRTLSPSKVRSASQLPGIIIGLVVWVIGVTAGLVLMFKCSRI